MASNHRRKVRLVGLILILGIASTAHADGLFMTAPILSVGDEPDSARVCDLNGDDINDVIVKNADSDDFSVLFGIGDGTFANQATLGSGEVGRWAVHDMDGDGDLDIVVGDVNGDGSINGADIPGFLRVKFGTPIWGDVASCADYATGTLDGDVAAFVADLLGE